MKNIKSIFFVVLTFCIALSSCATKYKHKHGRLGYKETQTGEETYSVSFKGNGFVSEDKAADYCLLRCAELAENNGFKYFKVVTNNESTESPTYKGTTSGTSARSHVNIRVFAEKPDGDNVYEAKYVIKNMKAKYHVKLKSSENATRSQPYE